MIRAAVVLAGLMLATPAAAQAAPPTCKDAELTILPNATLPLGPPSCTDPEGDPWLIAGYSMPAHGTINPGAMSYTPTPGYVGFDEFTFQVRDNHNETSAPARVRLLIDTAPECRNGSATVVSGRTLVLPDLDCNDPNDDDFTVFVLDPAHGTIALPDDGSVVYTPAPGFVGTDSFDYYGRDIYGLESYTEWTMTITVTPAPPPAPAPTVAPPSPPPPPPPPRPKDVSAPAIALKNASKKQAVAVNVTTNENASATLTVAIDKATAKKLKLSRTVGTLKAALTPGASTLKLKLSAKAAKAFKKLKSVKLTVTAVVADAAGNQTTKTLKVTLKK